MSKDNGGPAFPIEGDQQGNYAEGGMSLRDYFAAKAMMGILSDPNTGHGGEDRWSGFVSDLAGEAYDIADAMLAEREK